MKKTRFIKFLAVIVCFLPLNCCERGNGDPDPVETDPKEESLPTEEEMLAVLRESGRYEVGEHSCMVEVSTDSYEYPSDTSGYNVVPQDQIDNMSTLGLMETVLENPRFDVYGLPGFDRTFFYLSHYVPGLLEGLDSRSDAASLLIERYLGMYYSCDENNYSSVLGKGVPVGYPEPEDQLSLAFTEIQVLIARYEILDKATEEEIDSLSVHIVRTYLAGKEKDEYFHLWAGRASIWLAARIMEHQGYHDYLVESGVLSHAFFLEGNFFILSPETRTRFMLLFNEFINERLE